MQATYYHMIICQRASDGMLYDATDVMELQTFEDALEEVYSFEETVQVVQFTPDDKGRLDVRTALDVTDEFRQAMLDRIEPAALPEMDCMYDAAAAVLRQHALTQTECEVALVRGWSLIKPGAS